MSLSDVSLAFWHGQRVLFVGVWNSWQVCAGLLYNEFLSATGFMSSSSIRKEMARNLDIWPLYPRDYFFPIYNILTSRNCILRNIFLMYMCRDPALKTQYHNNCFQNFSFAASDFHMHIRGYVIELVTSSYLFVVLCFMIVAFCGFSFLLAPDSVLPNFISFEHSC